MDNNHNEKEGEHARKEAGKTEAENRLPGRIRLGVSGTIFAVCTLICGGLLATSYVYWQKGGYENAKTAFYWLIPACVVFAVCVLSAYWYNVVKPARDAEDIAARTAKARDEAAKVVLDRPELFAEIATAEMIPGQPRRVAIQFVNRGAKTALNLTAWINYALTDPDFPGPLKFEALEPDTRPDVAPKGGTVTLVGGSKQKPDNRAVFDAIIKGSKLWFVYGKATYQDETGAIYPMDFCFQYDTSIAPNLRICPDRYWPKKGAQLIALPQQRPDLSLEYAECQFVPGKPARVSILIENRGKATAYDIEAEASNYFAHTRTFKGPMEHDPSEPPYSYPSLAPGAKMFGHTEQTEGGVLSIQDVADLRDRKLLFLHYSKGQYRDEAGNNYPIKFCLMYDPDDPVMRIAPKAFWPRDLIDF